MIVGITATFLVLIAFQRQVRTTAPAPWKPSEVSAINCATGREALLSLMDKDLSVHLEVTRTQAVISSIGCHTGTVLGTKRTANIRFLNTLLPNALVERSEHSVTIYLIYLLKVLIYIYIYLFIYMMCIYIYVYMMCIYI